MALTNLHTNWENGSYANDRNKFLKEKENPNLAGGGSYGLTPYFDGSIAIGYGYDLLVHTNAQINSLLTSMGMQPLSTADATLLDQARAQVNAGTATPTYLRDDVASQLTLTLPNEPVAAAMLDTMLNQYETALDTALGGHDQLGDSKERAAIISLLYTMTTPTSAAISATIPSTIKAIINDNRAEAWYGIRYGSNADGQHASRRYAEAHFFGLYDSGSTFTDPNEAKEVMRMYTKHKFEIVTYEINYPPSSNGNYASIDTDIAPAKNYLISTFGQGQSIGNVIVGKGLDSYVYQEQSSLDKIIGTTYNDLIFGEKGSDILDGGAGEDVIYGGEGNDMITGGQGNDYLEGGAGNDIYYINTGDGTDTIEDKEGNNRVIVNGKEVGLLIKQDDGTYKNPDGKIKATIEGTDLVLYDTVTGAKVTVLNENFQDGDFGIHLLEAPDSPQTNIVGDLTPIDFDPTIEGIQTKTDVWGNVIVDPKNPYPNRNDMLYDTSGN
ncbi:MAG: hypothetical protein M0Z70_04130, partial [Nitrospiraceae bacterium]|nr:hypothetical protein [Nitrospiraceae bacterium]